MTLGQVGIILSSAVTRLSRTCSDWYPLLDLWSYKGCLIADVEGLYADWPNPESVIRTIGVERLRTMLPHLESGMVPKMEACLKAVSGGVSRATVVDGREPHAVLLELFTDEGVGTMVTP